MLLHGLTLNPIGRTLPEQMGKVLMPLTLKVCLQIIDFLY